MLSSVKNKSMLNLLYMHDQPESVGKLSSAIENNSILNPTEIPLARNPISTLSTDSERIEFPENRLVSELYSEPELNSVPDAHDLLQFVPGR